MAQVGFNFRALTTNGWDTDSMTDGDSDCPKAFEPAKTPDAMPALALAKKTRCDFIHDFPQNLISGRKVIP